MKSGWKLIAVLLLTAFLLTGCGQKKSAVDELRESTERLREVTENSQRKIDRMIQDMSRMSDIINGR